MQSIDLIDRKILFELDKNARIPDTQLAKKVGRSKESIRYRIQQLQKKRIITGFHTWIDPTKVGFHTYKMYLKLENLPEQRREFLKHLKEERRMFWIGVADGAWDFGLTFFAKNNLEFYDLQNEITSKFSSLILNKRTGVLVNVMVCSKNFFTEGSPSHTVMFSEPESYELDQIEQQAITHLFKNARVSLVQLARQCNTSVDIVRHRLRRLESHGVITQYKVGIDFTKLGLEFYKAFLFFRKLSKKDEERVVEYVRQHPNIVHLVRQISPWDMELEIMVENYAQYNEIINKIREEFADIIVDVESAIMSEDHAFPAGTPVFTPTS